MATWEDINKVNSEINLIKLPNKKKDKNGNWQLVESDYAEVKERVIAFRKLYPEGSITTEIEETKDHFIATTKIIVNNLLISVGHAREVKTNRNAYETAETSSVGRAIGFLGIGISTGIASAEDMQKIKEDVFDEPIENPNDLVEDFIRLYSLKERTQILNHYHVMQEADLGAIVLRKYINDRLYEK